MKKERAIIVKLQTKNTRYEDISPQLDEISFLAWSAGAEIVEKVIQKKEKIHPVCYIGEGKVGELKALSEKVKADLVIFDDDLSPRQQTHLENEIGVKVIDRTQLILDIFAQRAKTSEAKSQVELAQLSYLLPRLKGKGVLLSRLGGGIGTLGPGETKLETDRRHLRERISALKQAIKDIKKHRSLHRKRRKSEFRLCCLVGYTNAGKSTLINALCDAEVYTDDRLFATLSPTVRILQLPHKEKVFLTDTVGFIRKIPHYLIASFRATLEEAIEADLLLNVVDISSVNIDSDLQVVYDILTDLKINDKPLITVLNKIDKVEDKTIIKYLSSSLPNCVEISAKNKEGLDKLTLKIEEILFGKFILVKLIIPRKMQRVISLIYKNSKIISSVYENDQVVIVAQVSENVISVVEPYIKVN